MSLDDPAAIHYTVKHTALLALMFCPIWFIANYSFNVSLDLTSVSSNTIISSTSSFFTLVFGFVVDIESIRLTKFLAVITCIGGVVLVSYNDISNSGKSPVLGDGLALISAITYGVYTVYLRKQIPHEKTVSMPMFFGFVGLFNILMMWPFFFLLNATKTETFELPSKWVLLSLFLNGLIGTVLSDLLWSLVVFFSSALVATMGLVLTIPLAMIVDLILGHKKFTVLYVLGSLLVILGFFLVNLPLEKEKHFLDWIKRKCPCQKHELDNVATQKVYQTVN